MKGKPIDRVGWDAGKVIEQHYVSLEAAELFESLQECAGDMESVVLAGMNELGGRYGKEPLTREKISGERAKLLKKLAAQAALEAHGIEL